MWRFAWWCMIMSLSLYTGCEQKQFVGVCSIVLPLSGWPPAVSEPSPPASWREQPALCSSSSAAWPSPQSLGRCSSAKLTGNKYYHQTMPAAINTATNRYSGGFINALNEDSVQKFYFIRCYNSEPLETQQEHWNHLFVYWINFAEKRKQRK